jgi:hypothetical protein
VASAVAAKVAVLDSAVRALAPCDDPGVGGICFDEPYRIALNNVVTAMGTLGAALEGLSTPGNPQYLGPIPPFLQKTFNELLTAVRTAVSASKRIGEMVGYRDFLGSLNVVRMRIDAFTAVKLTFP